MAKDESSDKENAGTRSSLPSSILLRLVDQFFFLVAGFPIAVRVLFGALILCVAGALAYISITRNHTPKLPDNLPKTLAMSSVTGQPYINGKKIDRAEISDDAQSSDNDDPRNKIAERASSLDNAAFKWHAVHHNEDDPKEHYIAKTDDKNFIEFQYYSKSDRCLLVNREEAGVAHLQWIFDPAYAFRRHDMGTTAFQGQDSHTPAIDESAVYAATRNVVSEKAVPPPSAIGLKVQPVQVGSCVVGVHPGSFNYWWGPPINACVSPMYRRFADGCIHYQLYNHCANAWDQQIFWTACHPPPHF